MCYLSPWGDATLKKAQGSRNNELKRNRSYRRAMSSTAKGNRRKELRANVIPEPRPTKPKKESVRLSETGQSKETSLLCQEMVLFSQTGASWFATSLEPAARA